MNRTTGNKTRNSFRTLYAAGLCAALVPSGAHALNLEEVTLTSDPSDVIVTVRADEALTAPSVKSYDGEVRVRFPTSHVARTHQVHGDGRAIQLIELRPGSHETTVLRFDLGDDTKLADADVRVEQRKNSTVFRIARDLLPPLRELPGTAQVAEAVKAPAEKPAAALPAPQPKLEQPKPKAADPAEKTAAQKPSLASALAQGSSPMPMLLIITSLLGLAYLALRGFLKKQSVISEQPSIEVVAQKRIGARHQLVIVRAFGQDHLLSIQGTTTTPIASSDAGDEGVSLDSATRLLAERRAEQTAPEPVAHKAQPEPTRIEAKGRSQDVSRDESAMFGGELLRLAIAQKQRTSTPAPAAERQSVREVARETRERLVAQAPQQAQQSQSNARPRQTDQALSKAVAGLVRMRRDAR
jgi:flagellar biogenesis protein FliO